MLRILLTVPHLSSQASPYRHMLAIAKFLPKDEFQLIVCSLRTNGYEEAHPLLQSMGIPCFVAHFRPRKARNVRNPFQWMWHGITLLAHQPTIQKNGPYDLQHSFDFVPWPIEPLLARLFQRPFVFSQRNLNYGGSSMMLRMKLQLSTKVIAVSQASADLLTAHGAQSDQLRLIHNGLDLQAVGGVLNDIEPTGPRYILNVGHIQDLKRQADAINAFAIIAAELPDLLLYFVGNVLQPAYQRHLEALATEYGLATRIHFLGLRNDVLPLMRQATLLLHTSLSDAMPMVVFEAMAAGLPVVASRSGGVVEMLEDGKSGFLLEVGNIEGYARAMKTLLTQQDTAAQFAKNARQTLERRFSAESMVAQIADVYREAINER